MRLKTQDIEILNKLFEMEQGHVLDFSHAKLNAFFVEEFNIDFEDGAFLSEGTSKAKKLRCFFKITDRNTVITVLKSLWAYKKMKTPEKISATDEALFS